MKHFLALPALLRGSVLLALASQHSFSVQDDIFAFPQYEVRFADEWIPADQVPARLASNAKGSTSRTSERSEEQARTYTQVGQYRQQQPLVGGGHDTTIAHDDTEYEHERMVLDGQPWLCRIPKVKTAATAGSANETVSQAEQDKELTRALDRGWELLSGMEGNCVFFISGWWSYRFCYNQGIKQFHQLSPSRGVPVYPPVEDAGVPGFMLGTYAKRLDADDTGHTRDWDGESALEKSEGAKRFHSKHGELVQRGESRYLVQKLGGGTVCDLTGKERKIEVQFHCSPQAVDRIALIKETSTCAYLMVIQTPRLCNDVAFLPPQKDHPNSISCSPILRDEQVAAYEQDIEALKAEEREVKEWLANSENRVATAAAMAGIPEAIVAGITGAVSEGAVLPVGDVFVGGHRLVPEGVKIEKSAIVGGGKETYIDTLADSDGKIISKEELERLGVSDPKAVEKLKKEMEQLAQGQAWKLDVIDTPRGREYRGIIGEGEEEGAMEQDSTQDDSSRTAKGDGVKAHQGEKKQAGKTVGAQNGNKKLAGTQQGDERLAGKATGSQQDTKKKQKQKTEEEEKKASHVRKQDDDEKDDQLGSEEEFYKDEL